MLTSRTTGETFTAAIEALAAEGEGGVDVGGVGGVALVMAMAIETATHRPEREGLRRRDYNHLPKPRNFLRCQRQKPLGSRRASQRR